MRNDEITITESLAAIRDIISARVKSNEKMTGAILDELSSRLNVAKYLYSIMH